MAGKTVVIPESAYIHENEVHKFIHVQVPMDLIVCECFAGISGDAKILYGLLLNRTGLSLSNGWIDKNGRTYINYTIEDLMKELHISHKKVSKLFSELSNVLKTMDEEGNEVWLGLIEKVRVLNKPSLIYVHKVDEIRRLLETSSPNSDGGHHQMETTVVTEKEYLSSPNGDDGHHQMETTVVTKRKQPSSPNGNDGRHRTETTDITKWKPRSSPYGDENYNNMSNNNLRDNNLIISFRSVADCSDAPLSKMDKMIFARDIIRENIEYDELITRHGWEYKERLDELVEIMVEACICEGDFIIGGREVPHDFVEAAFMKYDSALIEYVMESVETCIKDVRNPKKYLLATLYNATMTISNHTRMQVGHDMYESAG